jgi:hypothetical protein
MRKISRFVDQAMRTKLTHEPKMVNATVQDLHFTVSFFSSIIYFAEACGVVLAVGTGVECAADLPAKSC